MTLRRVQGKDTLPAGVGGLEEGQSPLPPLARRLGSANNLPITSNPLTDLQHKPQPQQQSAPKMQ
jgi:hypothetical protein